MFYILITLGVLGLIVAVVQFLCFCDLRAVSDLLLLANTIYLTDTLIRVNPTQRIGFRGM